jgi:hypothetical protein
MKVSAQYAAEHFGDLLIAVDSGQVVEIDRLDKPALQLVRLTVAQPPKLDGKRILGAGKGLLRVPGEKEWDAMDKEWRESFKDKFGD